MTTRRHVLLGGAFLAVSVAAFARLPDQRRPRLARGTLEGMVPDQFGPWTFVSNQGVILPTADEMQYRLYDNIVSRTYTAHGKPPIMLMLAYSSEQDGVLQIHRPEACYHAGGYDLSPTRHQLVEAAPGLRLPASAFTASSPDRTEQVLYWTRQGEAFPESWIGQKRGLVLANLHREIPDGMLVRVSALSPDATSATGLLGGFARALVAASSSPLRRLLIGGGPT